MKLAAPRHRFLVSVLAGALIVGVPLASTSASAAAKKVVKKPTAWTATVAVPATTTYLSAFPFMNAQTYTTAAAEDFQYLMYRPLYWFGSTNAVSMNPALSLATAPVWSKTNAQVSITLKNYRWSNGEVVNGADVVLWMNLLAAEPSMWANYVAPEGPSKLLVSIPDIVKDVVAKGQVVTFSLNRPVNHTWFLDNELSQITPLPAEWDQVASNWNPSLYRANDAGASLTPYEAAASNAGNLSITSAVGACPMTYWIGANNISGPSSRFVDSNGDDTVVNGSYVTAAQWCADVAATMVSVGRDTNDLANLNTETGRLMDTVDGPWKLSAFNPSTNTISFARNAGYRGPVAANSPSAINDELCGSVSACYPLVQSGALSQGQLPATSARAVSVPAQYTLAQSASAKAKGYALTMTPTWSLSYVAVNERSPDETTPGLTTNTGEILSQSYIRQALNELSNEVAMVQKDDRGYAYVENGPVPTTPTDATINKGVSTAAKTPFSPTLARALLSAHGWALGNKAGTTSCARPGLAKNECGASIQKGTRLSFSMVVASGNTADQAEENYFAAVAASVGIGITVSLEPVSTVLSTVAQSGSSWDLADWGSGWLFSPDYYPSGELLFSTGAVGNLFGYSSGLANAEINASIYSGASLATYANVVSANPPVLWRPIGVSLVETKANIKADVAKGGFLSNPLGTFAPELWSN